MLGVLARSSALIIPFIPPMALFLQRMHFPDCPVLWRSIYEMQSMRRNDLRV